MSPHFVDPRDIFAKECFGSGFTDPCGPIKLSLTAEEYEAVYKKLPPGYTKEIYGKDLLLASIEIVRPFDGVVLDYRFVGSRETCNPPPTDTDLDILILTNDFPVLRISLDICGFVPDLGYEKLDKRFESFRREEVNLIVTESRGFFERFCEAARICKELNVKSKEHRILIHNLFLKGVE
jgi:hypothetical protein